MGTRSEGGMVSDDFMTKLRALADDLGIAVNELQDLLRKHGLSVTQINFCKDVTS